MIFVCGEIIFKVVVDYQIVICDIIKKIGYDDFNKGQYQFWYLNNVFVDYRYLFCVNSKLEFMLDVGL